MWKHVGAFNHEKVLVRTFSVFIKFQASCPALHGVRVTMRGDMNGDSVCISGSGSGLHPARVLVCGGRPSLGPPASGLLLRPAPATAPPHATCPTVGPELPNSNINQQPHQLNIAHTPNIFGVENIFNHFSAKEYKIKFIKKVNILVKTSIIELFWRNQNLSRILCLNWLLANKKVFWRLKMSLSIEETQTIQTNYLCR